MSEEPGDTPEGPAGGRPWVDGLTIGEALRRVAGRLPDHEALVFPQDGFRASYAEYDRLVVEAGRGDPRARARGGLVTSGRARIGVGLGIQVSAGRADTDVGLEDAS